MLLTQGTTIKFKQWDEIPCVEHISELETSHQLLRSQALRYVHQPEENRSFRLRRVWAGNNRLKKVVKKTITTESIDLIHLQNATLAGDFGLFFGDNEACVFPFYRNLHMHLSPEKFDGAKLLRQRLASAFIDPISGVEGVLTSDVYTFRLISDPVFIFGKPHAHAYSHFIWDSLSALWWLRLLPDNVKVLVPSDIAGYQKEILHGAGITDDRIIWRNGREHIKFSNVYVPSFCAVNNRWICDDALQFFSGLRDCSASAPSRLIYFDRGGDRSGVRKLLNEQQIIDVCEELGFERITPAELNFEEKRKVFSETAVMVGQFGGGIQTHFLMQPRTSILCLHSEMFVRNIFEYTAAKLGQDVTTVIGKATPAVSGDPNNSHFEIDLDTFKSALRQVLASSFYVGVGGSSGK